jgi:tetratricopeptide (TPR) repeat protein
MSRYSEAAKYCAAQEIAMDQLEDGRLEDAERIYQQFLQVEPDGTFALNLLGAIAYIVGKPEIADMYLRRALQLQRDNAFAYFVLGAMQGNKADLEGKEAIARRCLDLARAKVAELTK